MLVLTRKEGQRIQIGHATTITITKIKGNVVRIGVEAPKHLSVMRGELLHSADSAAASRPQRLAS